MPTTPPSPGPRAHRPAWRSRWWMPAFSLFFGALMLAAFWIGGKRDEGLGALAVMAALALVFAFGGRSETVRGLGGPGRDERWDAIDLQATAFSGMAVVFTVLGAFLVELARGEDGAPYAQLAFVGGVAYVAAVAFLRWRF